MYHEVYAAAPPTGASAGASVYHVSREAFLAHLRAIRDADVAVRTVGDWVDRPARERDHVALTFDDGWEGSLGTGVECLADAGLRATFFVTRDLVGTRHFAGKALLRDARAAGMEIGAHGTTHRFLSECSETEIRAELSESKAFLEDVLGEPVVSGSVPGGAWTPVVARVARECGYRALCTSRPGVNRLGTDPMRLHRVGIRRDTTAYAVGRYARGAIGREVVRAAALELPRRLLGRRRYADFRARLLGERAATRRG
jgi:peptidoglycan/xylan/chitin deacetylase (PgdA/CDA1 family)